MNKHTLEERALLTTHPVSKTLFELMVRKKSNLCVTLNYLTKCEEWLSLIPKIGGEICLLKTHIDTLEDFEPAFLTELKSLSQKHEFLLFEDRKFADIGQTAFHQYKGGIYRIAEWADITNAHILPGKGIIEGLREVGLPLQRGLLLLAEMSSEGALAKGEYTDLAVQWAEEYPDFVMGFISQKKVSSNPCLIHFTPGIQMDKKGDGLKQRYRTPWEALTVSKSDVIIVGRGVMKAPDVAKAALHYREEGWKAYLHTLTL